MASPGAILSQYLLKIGDALATVFEHAASAQPQLFVGYVANFDFWLQEYAHLVDVQRGYDERRQQMQTAYANFVAKQGGPDNLDEFGKPIHTPMPTSSRGDQHDTLIRTRTALLRLIDRARDLQMIGVEDRFRLIDQVQGVTRGDLVLKVTIQRA